IANAIQRAGRVIDRTLDGIGDERLTFSGVPIPETATYFGRLQDGRGVPDLSQQRTGIISAIIADTGILHHVVAGDRDVALATLKRHLAMLKWTVRGIGTSVVIGGFMMFFASIFRFLFRIPIVGSLVKNGSWLLAIVLGLTVSIFTITLSYLIAHPLLLFGILGVLAVIVGWFWYRGRAARTHQEQFMRQEYGHVLDSNEIKDNEFIHLVQLALSDGQLDDDERAGLRTWADQQGWDDAKFEECLTAAQSMPGGATQTSQEHVEHLAHLAMADGQMSLHEVRYIREAANRAGLDQATVQGIFTAARGGFI
ncbi:MAG: TMEM43 family protein, partial [Planctomycetota bacterium]